MMTKRQKRLQKMRQNRRTVSYGDYISTLDDYGYEIWKRKGSHRGAKRTIGNKTWILTFVEPHGNRKFMHPEGVKELLAQIDEIEETLGNE
jgi:predicted RNA binding protein YcfA (HicA-like mRNA interferase family)